MVAPVGKKKRLRASFWWIDRWRKSTAYTDMTLEERAVYRELLDELWTRDGVLPKDDRILMRVGGASPAEWARVRDAVLRRFYETTEGYRHETHDEVAAQCVAFREAQAAKGRKGAESRWKSGDREDGTGHPSASSGHAPANGRANSRANGPAMASDSVLRTPTTDSDTDSDSGGNGEAAAQPPVPPGAAPNAGVAIDAVVEHYRGIHPRARPGAKERKAIASRLREGWSVDELRAAIDGNHRDPHCCGMNDRGAAYHDLTLIFRDSSHVQRYLAVPRDAVPRARPANVAAIDSFLARTGGGRVG